MLLMGTFELLVRYAKIMHKEDKSPSLSKRLLRVRMIKVKKYIRAVEEM
jgi:hypothetical protein